MGQQFGHHDLRREVLNQEQYRVVHHRVFRQTEWLFSLYQISLVSVSGLTNRLLYNSSSPTVCILPIQALFLKIPSYTSTILQVFLAIMLLQIVFFPQYLAMEEPYPSTQIN